MKNLNNHYRLIRYSFLTLVLFFQQGLLADDLVAEPFLANYDAYRNGSHIAESRFQLKQQNGAWVWNMRTRPRGLYRWLTSKKPFTETRMVATVDGLRLSQMSGGDYADRPPRESAWFDQAAKTVFYTDSQAETPRQIDMPDELFNYHSVHLLYQRMKQAGQTELEIRFFKKGDVHSSTLSLQQGVDLLLDDTTMQADKVVHKVAGSNRTMVYYYRDHPLAPLVIKQIKGGKVTNEMRRRSLQ